MKRRGRKTGGLGFTNLLALAPFLQMHVEALPCPQAILTGMPPSLSLNEPQKGLFECSHTCGDGNTIVTKVSKGLGHCPPRQLS